MARGGATCRQAARQAAKLDAKLAAKLAVKLAASWLEAGGPAGTEVMGP